MVVRIKYYLRGIGFGIIFAVIVMSVALGKNNKQQISDAEIIQRAKQLGMIDAETVSEETETQEVDSEINQTIDKEESKASKQDTTKLNDTKKTDKEQVGTVEAKTNTSSDVVEQKSEQNEQNKNDEVENDTSSVGINRTEDDQEESSQNENEDTGYVTITVKRGQVCREIAEELQRLGAVDDAEAFRVYMGRSGAASSIRCGTFQIKKGASYKEIADCLVKR